MIAFWMLWSIWLGVITVGVALVAERAVVSWRVPRRAVWAVACSLIVAASIGGVIVPRLWRSAGARTTPLTAARAGAHDAVGPSPSLTTPSIGARGRNLRDAWMDTLAPFDDLLLALWVVTIVVLAALTGIGNLRLRRARRAWRTERVDGEDVLVSERTGPAIIGVRTPSIVVPRWALAYDAPLRALVVGHEREHVLARDPLLLGVARVAAVLLPWNVALWWSLNRLKLAVEMDCDARVLRALPDRRRYGLLLVAVAQTRARVADATLAPVLGFMRRSELAKRVMVMSAARHVGRVRGASLVGAALLTGLAIACDTPAPVMPATLTMSGLAFRSTGMLTRAEVLAWLRANRELNVDPDSVHVLDEDDLRRLYGVTRMPELLADMKVVDAAIRRELAIEAPNEPLRGRVRLELDIDEAGRATRIEAVDPPPLPEGVDAVVALTMDVPSQVLAVETANEDPRASAAVKRAAVRALASLGQFTPGELDGRPAPVRGMGMTFDFD
jgi:beta-lactamase regulating signal transducer with metallopeptidase domain